MIDNDLFYFALIKLSNGEYWFLIKSHHLICDAWTVSLLNNQVLEYYTKLKDGIQITEEKKPTYIQYISDEEMYEKSTEFKKSRNTGMKNLMILKEVLA